MRWAERQRHLQHGTCAGIIPCDASILAAAASPHGRTILQTQSGELLLYDGRVAPQLTRLGSFPEPCPSMHILPEGNTLSLPAKPDTLCNQHLSSLHTLQH